MQSYNLNKINSNLGIYNIPFKANNEESKSASNPIGNNDKEIIKKEFVSNEYANFSKAIAMAQVLIGNDYKPGMTQKEYVENLVKKGKILNKDFFVSENPSSIEELNKKGQKIKETFFLPEEKGKSVVVKLYNPNTQKVYKFIDYTPNEYLTVEHNNPNTEKLILKENYTKNIPLVVSGENLEATFIETPSSD